MKIRRFPALAGALVALGLITAAGAQAAGGPAVSVRVEGVKATLLPATTVQTRGGWITQGHTPRGTCAAGTAAVATKRHWNGSYGQHGLSVTSILGETHPLTASARYRWSIWVDNRHAPAGVCGLKLHQGEQLLFAAVPEKGNPYPIVLSAPSRAIVGHSFRVQAFYQGANGRTPLASADVAVGAKHGLTNQHGYITLAPTHPGRFTIVASHPGDIRDETSVTVTG
jgi:hypothetical protein